MLLDGRHLDFPRRLTHVPRLKTDASERSIPMLPSLYELLLEHRTEFDYGPDEPVFATRTGRRNHPDNVRGRIVSPAGERANELLAEARLGSIRRLTTHSAAHLRLAAGGGGGEPAPRHVPALACRPEAHDARLQQVLDMDGGAPEQLEQLLGCSAEEAFVVPSGREFPHRNRTRARNAARALRIGGAKNVGTRSGSGLPSKRLMGFEPSTFCMAISSSPLADRPEMPANRPISAGLIPGRVSKNCAEIAGI